MSWGVTFVPLWLFTVGYVCMVCVPFEMFDNTSNKKLFAFTWVRAPGWGTD